MKCNGAENTVEGEQPPAAASNDVPCEKGTTSNGSKEASPSPHPKPSPSLNDCVGQSLDNNSSNNDTKVEPKLESSRPGSACPDGTQSNEPWGNQKQEYPSTSTPSGTQTTASNGPQNTPQTSQLFVFTTHLANLAADAVLSAHFPSIVAYHCAQPNTRQMLERRRAIIGAMAPGWGPGGPMPGGPMGGPPNHPGYMNNHFPPGNFQGPPNGPPFGMSGANGPRGMNAMGPGGPMAPANSPMNAPFSMGAPSSMGPHGQMGPGGPGGPMGHDGRPNPGVKVADENLTPQQRQHRHEQLATLCKMRQMLFREDAGNPGGPSGGPGPRMMQSHGPPGPMQGGAGHPYGPGGPMGASKGPRGQYPPNPRQSGPGGPPNHGSQYNFRPPEQPRPMSPAMMGHPQSPYQGGPMGGPGGPSPDPSQMGGPGMNFKPSTSPQLHPGPSNSPHLSQTGKSKNSNPMSPVDLPGGMMPSPQHMGFNPLDGGQGGPGGPGQPPNDGLMGNDPVALLEGFDSNGMSHPGGPVGGPSPGPGGRMVGQGGPPYGGSMGPGVPQGGSRGRTNVQVRPDAPNTIQYLPARSQGPGQSPNAQMPQQRQPSLEFLHRLTGPGANNMKGMSPGGPMGVPMGQMGNGPLGGPQGGPMGGPGSMANGPGGQPPMQYYADQQHQQGPPGGTGFNGPPGGGGGGPNQNKFYGPQNPTSDPIYAAQYHNFQQQLYATNTTKGLK